MVTKTVRVAEPSPPAENGDAGQGPATPLENLALQADNLAVTDLDAAGDEAVQQPAAPEPPTPTNSEICTGIFVAMRETACEVASIESPRRTLTDEKVSKLGTIWGGVFDSYGINLHGTMGKHAAIFAAIMMSAPILAPVVAGVREELAQNAGKKPIPAAPPAPVAAAAGGGDGVIKPTWEH